MLIDKRVFTDNHFGFLLKAVGKDKGRTGVCNKLGVTKEHIMATDGYRVHLIPNAIDLEIGTYFIQMASKTKCVIEKADCYSFPDIKPTLDEPVIKEEPFFCGYGLGSKSIMLFGLYDTACINYNFFNDAVDEGTDYVIKYKDRNVVLESSKNCIAVIMKLITD